MSIYNKQSKLRDDQVRQNTNASKDKTKKKDKTQNSKGKIKKNKEKYNKIKTKYIKNKDTNTKNRENKTKGNNQNLVRLQHLCHSWRLQGDLCHNFAFGPQIKKLYLWCNESGVRF